MNPIRHLAEAIADRIHAAGDAQARGYGLTVQRLPWGRRRIYDRRVVVWLDQRRRRVISDGLDHADRALLDPATADLLADTARRMTAERAARHTAPAAGRPELRPAA